MAGLVMKTSVGGLVLVTLGLGCTGENPTTPTVAPGVAPAAPTTASGNTVTIRDAQVSPQMIQIRLGERVLFVNNDDVAHEMSSDLHPSHLECPVINQAGFISPGQSKETGNFVTPRTCTFHDHLDALNSGLLGTIVIVE